MIIFLSVIISDIFLLIIGKLFQRKGMIEMLKSIIKVILDGILNETVSILLT